MSDIIDDMGFQIQQQGIAAYKVKDGEVFIFTTAILKSLLAKAAAAGQDKVIVMINPRPQA